MYAPLDGSEVNALPVTLTVVDGDAPLDKPDPLVHRGVVRDPGFAV